MTKVIHSKPPKPQAGQFMVLVNGPTPWETIANDKNSARAGSDATWRLEVIGVPVVTVTQEAWVLCDINGNWRSGS